MTSNTHLLLMYNLQQSTLHSHILPTRYTVREREKKKCFSHLFSLSLTHTLACTDSLSYSFSHSHTHILRYFFLFFFSLSLTHTVSSRLARATPLHFTPSLHQSTPIMRCAGPGYRPIKWQQEEAVEGQLAMDVSSIS